MKDCVEKREMCKLLQEFSVAILFYQPSTRTFSSFVAAAERLGAYTTAIHGMEEYSSAAKGESLPDTIRSIHQTTAADAIVLRHPQDNSSKLAADFSPVPIISAGSGSLEHPTQALLDLRTICESFNLDSPLRVALVGDLLYGRTAKSLAKLLTLVNPANELVLVSPNELQMPPELVNQLQSKGVSVLETEDFETVLPEVDVVYMTRVQKEWFEKQGRLEDYERLKASMTLTRDRAEKMDKDSIILHPLPRQEELRYGVDANPRAKYFDQMRYGLYVRMALLLCTLQENPAALLGIEV